MKGAITIIIGVLAANIICGQYTYFNKDQLPPDYQNNNSGLTTNLLVNDIGLITFGSVFIAESGFVRYHLEYDFSGSLQQEYIFDFPDNENMFPRYSESIFNDDTGYTWAGAYQFTNDLHDIPVCQHYDSNLEIEWQYALDQYSDSQYASSFFQVIRLADNSYCGIAGLRVELNTIKMILVKFAPDSTYWVHEYAFYENEYFPIEETFFWASDIVELSNGQLLVSGFWDSPLKDAFLIKFDSTGNFLGHHRYGHPEIDDYMPYMAPTDNPTQYMFAYAHGQSELGVGEHYDKPRVCLFDTELMDTLWCREYDYEYYAHYVTDMERTPDGNYAILGYSAEPETSSGYGMAYILKVDGSGNELWYHQYYPPIDHVSPSAYDLEVTPDSGFAVVGNFQPFDENNEPTGYYNTWVFKTDPCGDLEYSGCNPSTITERHPELVSGSLLISPNPTNSIVSISSNYEMQSITIRDITGKTVLQQPMQNHVLQTQVDVSMLAKGLYLIEADFGGGRVSAQRLVVE